VLPPRIVFHKKVANHGGRRAPSIEATKEQQALIHNQPRTDPMQRAKLDQQQGEPGSIVRRTNYRRAEASVVHQ